MMTLIWDGFTMLGEGFGLSPRRARLFADLLWTTVTTLTTVWAAGMFSLAVR